MTPAPANRSAWGLAGLVAALGLGACTTEYETLRRAESRVDEAYVSPDADFSRYRRLRAYPLEIYFYEGTGEPDPATVERLRSIFQAAFLAAIGDDYEVVPGNGRDVLGVRASLVDLKHGEALGALPVTGRAARLVANGQLSFFMELTDSSTGRTLARAADRERPPAAPAEYDEARTWAETEAAAERWAALFRAFLDENLGR